MSAADKEAWVRMFVEELRALGLVLPPAELEALADDVWPSSKHARPADVARDVYGEH